MNKLVVIVVALIMVFAGLIAYHIYNEPADQHFYLHMHILNSTAIGNFSIGSYHYDIKYPWFNTTMAGYNNYTIQFQNYIAYNNISNKTAHLYLVKNTTFTFSPLPLWYVPINITNTNDTATPKNFQAMVKINWSAYSKYLLPSLSNVRFYNSTSFTPSHELAAWMENNNTLQARSSIVWVNMSGTVITGKSSVKIYMLFGPSTENFGKHWGEAPQLSATYGQYDNGAKVFSFYDNFAGTTLSSRWTTGGVYSGSVDNGLTLTSPSVSGGIYASYSATSGILETYWEQTAAQTFKVIFLNQLSIGTGWYADGYNSKQLAGLTTDQNLLEKQVGGSTTVLTTGLTNTQLSTYYIVGLEWNGANGLLNETLNYSSISSATDTTYTSMVGISLMTWGAATNIIKWVRVRAYPPSGTMPASQFLSPALSNILNSSPIHQGQIYLE